MHDPVDRAPRPGRDADVIVVGAGHNGLACAAYLARSGLDTLLVEARADVGGCASTVSDLGARFNICNCDHTLVRAMPLLEELDLTSVGLRYLEPATGMVNLFHDGSMPWIAFHDVEEMVASIAAAYPGEVDGYRRYLADALPAARLALDIARSDVTTPAMVATALRRGGRGARTLVSWSRASALDVLRWYFSAWQVWMPVVSTGPTVWGVAPETPGTGLAALGYATRHLVRTGRPEGGSGALTDALARRFELSGGRVVTGKRVERLAVRDGRVEAVTLTDGTVLRARAVVAACDPRRVAIEWLDGVPSAALGALGRWRAEPDHDGYESKVDAVIAGLPRYAAADVLEARHPGVDVLSATAVVSPDPAGLAAAHALRRTGEVSDHPTLLVNVPSVLDPSVRADDGGHVLSLETLFTPYGLPGGWPGSSEPARWIEVWAAMLAEGGRPEITRWRAMTPDRYEREFSMHRGHTPSFAGSPLDVLLGRDRELTRYRTSLSGLYLTGAATFPGAGIVGASGRNTASAVRRDLDRRARRFRVSR